MADLRERCWHALREGHKEDALRLLSKIDHPDPHFVDYAAKHGWQDVCRQLVENYNLISSDQIHWYRPLHLACEYGRVEVVKYLLTLPPVMRTVNQRVGYDGSAIELACRGGHLSVIKVLVSEPSVHMPNDLPSDKFAILSLLSRIRCGSTEFPIRPYFPVFMAGNSATGKTTLTKAVLLLTEYSSPMRMVTDVKTLTAGICPSKCSG